MNIETTVIKEGFLQMDFVKVTEMLTNAYWSVGISQAKVEKGAANSTLVFGVFDEADNQIAYGRVLSDKIRFCYLMDIIVDEAFRRKGIGQVLVNHILNHAELKDVTVFALRTGDAHGVYQKSGFMPIDKPEEWMILQKK